MYITTNYELISWIEQEKQTELLLREIVLISLVDSFRKQNQKCQMSQKGLTEICRCSKRTIGNVIKKLKNLNIIKVWYPPNQQQEQLACTIWLHDDIIDIIKELQAVAKDAIGPVATAVANGATHNKIIGDSESSLEEDSSSQAKLDLDNALSELNFFK